MGYEASGQLAIPRRVLAFAAYIFLVLVFATPSSAGVSWTIDPTRTRISFSIDAVGYPKTTGEFSEFEGHIAVDLGRPSRSLVSFRVKAESVDAGSASLNSYLRSAVLLNAPQFPEIAFESTSVEKIDDRHVRVFGDLTMLGVTRPLSVEVEVQDKQQNQSRLGFVAQTKIDRLAFGMNSGFPIISREIDLTVASEAFEK